MREMLESFENYYDPSRRPHFTEGQYRKYREKRCQLYILLLNMQEILRD